MNALIYASKLWPTWIFWMIHDICRRIFPAVTQGLVRPNVLAGPDSRSHAKYITQVQSGRTVRDDCLPSLKMMSAISNPFQCHCTIYEAPWHTSILYAQHLYDQTWKRMQIKSEQCLRVIQPEKREKRNRAWKLMVCHFFYLISWIWGFYDIVLLLYIYSYYLNKALF